MNKYDEAEEKGRSLFKNLYKEIWGFAQFETEAPVDGIIITQEQEIYPVEIKTRNDSFGHYPDYIMEKTKADSLLKLFNNNKRFDGAYYVNILNDRMLIWDITKIDLGEASWGYFNRKTLEGNTKVRKLCYHLKPEDAIWNQSILLPS